ncbi:hypothetical protein [Liquorilactobacillus mali]|uniref:hypothetical protein n=2 Tax=Liquorilactobacillus mali TaxID=1618 RepID=UPI002350F134|nr:hypothetical protein [Liquorilactobacillus mali]
MEKIELMSKNDSKKLSIEDSFRYVELINSLSFNFENLGFIRTYDWINNRKAGIFMKLQNIANEESDNGGLNED